MSKVLTSLPVGERVGLIGALAVETAAKYLASRDVDGIMVGDGFGWRRCCGGARSWTPRCAAVN